MAPLLIPVLILALPIFDAFAVIFIRVRQKRSDEALALYRGVAASKPTHSSVQQKIASLLAANRDGAAAAARHYEEALRLGPPTTELHENLGTQRGRAGDTTGAAAAYRRAHDCDGESVRARVGLEKSLRALGDPSGLAEFLDEFDLCGGKVPIIPNLVADTPAEFGELAAGVAGAGAKLAEINLSCPHPQAAYTGLLTAQDPAAAAATTTAAAAHLPVIAKLSPNVSDIGAIAVACAEAGAAAISAINTMPALDIDTELEAPVLGNAFGGLSGPALLPIGLRCVLKAVRALRDAGHATPVIGIGGISSGEDAAKYLLCGAQAVQVGTSLGNNPERLGEIAAELGDWMERKGYTSLEQFRSNALEWLP